MKAVVATFNQEKALVGAFSVITNLQMDIFEANHYRLTSAVPAEGVVGRDPAVVVGEDGGQQRGEAGEAQQPGHHCTERLRVPQL